MKNEPNGYGFARKQTKCENWKRKTLQTFGKQTLFVWVDSNQIVFNVIEFAKVIGNVEDSEVMP